MTNHSQSADPPIVFSNGMGVESVAILLRWILEAGSRDFPLDRLLVVTSMLGHEWQDTIRDFSTHILPLFRRHNIRFVQLARGGQFEDDGIAVLDDSRDPTTLHSDGQFTLLDYLSVVGTVPQYGGAHLCSIKFKAWVIESWLEENVYGLVRHAFGYNAEETGRVRESEAAFASRAARVGFGFNADELDRVKDARSYDSLVRCGFYPLVEWGWNRQRCLDYIREKLGIVWRKSACVFCPFINLKREGLTRHFQFPAQAAAALALEYGSLAMNPRGTLYRDKALIDVMQEAGNVQALELHRHYLETCEWALYRVRRIYSAKGRADRCVEKFDVGTRREMEELLQRQVAAGSYVQQTRGITYVYQRQRQPNQYPTAEDYLVAAPSRVQTKARYGVPWFENKWAAMIEGFPLLAGNRVEQEQCA